MSLGGWQRLWVVLSALTLALVLAFVLSVHDSTNRVEDPQILARLMEDEVTTVEIEGIGKVSFPSDLTSEQISAHVKRGMSSTPPSAVTIAEALLRERAQRKASEAQSENRVARSENIRMCVVSVGAWLAFIAVVYVMGWAIGWVRRGFNAP